MIVLDLGNMGYAEAWARQEQAHAEVLAGGPEQLLLVEHTPVITFGRRGGQEKNLKAGPEELAGMGVEVIHSDRGGDVTFHGPGQVVAYPIVRLAEHRLSVGGYVQRLEDIVIRILGRFGIEGRKDRSAIGIWVDVEGTTAKICALGVRICRGVTLHGIALNVETDLRFFELIVPCGLANRPVTSLRRILGQKTPAMEAVKEAVGEEMSLGFAEALGI